MNLVIDIGNTRIKLALFSDRDLMFNVPLDELKVEHIQLFLDEHPQLNKAILSSVREYPAEIRNFLNDKFEQFVELDYLTPVPIVNRYQTPETLGLDRLAAAIGAADMFPAQNLLVVDAGTAITFDLVSANNEYLGGNISPGLETRFKALHQFTGKLPLVGVKDEFQAIGTDTESAIRAGVQLGVIFETEQYISYFSSIYPDLKVIITGGDARFFDQKLKEGIYVHFNLTMIGLNRILEYNSH
ncbi:type III pantothenate kinase [Gaoshiqia sediminis]|uniref:Type III pantothenate kinase n=1 Tax=Gaoshiqia sediminis TaxID=2986998 RepID=A0AA41Y7P9_9BACT|nr:type III pantothenate kinase [Gaoshiqia sediminis]MCW0482428.1 type III pantothenate kinase [Gaoshiqia sediminis]